jgi:hypothetical protein
MRILDKLLPIDDIKETDVVEAFSAAIWSREVSPPPVSSRNDLSTCPSVMAYRSSPEVLVAKLSDSVEIIPIRLRFSSMTAPPDEPVCDTTVPPTEITSIFRI